MRILRVLLPCLALALPLAAAAQDVAFTNRATDLKQAADPSAPTVANLAENTQVKVLARAGGWTRVDAAGKAGFVRVFHLRFPATVEGSSSSSGDDPLKKIGGFLTGQKSDAHANLATTGVRGLSKEDVKNASPDAAALSTMQSYRADKPQAQRFAHEGKLNEAKVDDPESKGARR
jgi:hypothetical protein